jgi:hypothetical protein
MRVGRRINWLTIVLAIGIHVGAGAGRARALAKYRGRECHTKQCHIARECALGHQAILQFACAARWNADCELLPSCPSRWAAGQDRVSANDSAATQQRECERRPDSPGLPSFQKETTRARCIQHQPKCCACARRQLGWNWPARGSSRSVVRYTYR